MKLFNATIFRKVLSVTSLLTLLVAYNNNGIRDFDSDVFMRTLIFLTMTWGVLWIYDALKESGYVFRKSWLWVNKKWVIIITVGVSFIFSSIVYYDHKEKEAANIARKIQSEVQRKVSSKYINWRNSEFYKCLANITDKREKILIELHKPHVSTNLFDGYIGYSYDSLKNLPNRECYPPFNQKKYDTIRNNLVKRIN